MDPAEAPPMVAIVGRPNVGKSTLVNRVLGRREAIVEARPGVTRDRKEVPAEWRGVSFRLVDTGGWLARGDTLDEKVSRQAEQAIGQADVVLLVVDATTGVTDEDARIADLLRRLAAPAVSALASRSFNVSSNYTEAVWRLGATDQVAEVRFSCGFRA